MKRQTAILKEIRDNGYSVNDEQFKEDLKNITPEFQQKYVTFYPDNTAEILQAKYRKRPVVPVVPEVTENSATTITQLERIEYSVVQLAGLVAQMDIKLDKLKELVLFKKPVLFNDKE